MDRYAEIDRILVVQLQEMGVDVDSFDDLLSKERFYSALTDVIRRLLPASETRDLSELRSGTGSWKKQTRQCKQMSEIVKTRLDYRGDFAYDNILYPTELIVRSILSFVLERLQRKLRHDEASRASLASGGAKREINDLISGKLRFLVKSSFTIPWSRPAQPLLRAVHTNLVFVPSGRTSVVSQVSKRSEQDAVSIFEDNVKSTTLEADREAEYAAKAGGLLRDQYLAKKRRRVMGFIGGVLKRGMRDFGDADDDVLLGGGGRKGDGFSNDAFARRVNFESLNDLGMGKKKLDVSSEEARAERKAELDRLDVAIQKLTGGIKVLDQKMEALRRSLPGIVDAEAGERRSRVELMAEFKVLKQTCSLYENKDENMRKLKRVSSQSAKKLITMNQEWEKYRAPRIEKIRRLKRRILRFKDEYRFETEKIRELKGEMRGVIGVIKGKQAEHRKLAEYYNSLPKEKDRNFYVGKILDFCRNIDDQNQIIGGILRDNRDLKDRIATSSAKALNVYKDLDDLVFNRAREEEGSKNKERYSAALYEMLADIHKFFKSMIDSVDSRGAHLSKIRDLESEIEKIQHRKDEENMARISADLDKIKTENAEILAQVQKLDSRYDVKLKQHAAAALAKAMTPMTPMSPVDGGDVPEEAEAEKEGE